MSLSLGNSLNSGTSLSDTSINSVGGGRLDGVLFSPSDISGLQLQFDATDTDNITVVVGASVWDDLSGNGDDALQGTTTLQPASGTRTIGGLNVLDFDGTDDYMAISGITSLFSKVNDFTFFIVFQADDTVSAQALFGTAAGGSDRFTLRIKDNDLETGIWNGTAYTRADTTFTDTAAGHIATVGYTATGEVLELWLDGVAAVGTGTAFGDNNVNTIIGAASDGGIPFNGGIGYILAYNKVVSTAERQQLESFLTSKFGL